MVRSARWAVNIPNPMKRATRAFFRYAEANGAGDKDDASVVPGQHSPADHGSLDRHLHHRTARWAPGRDSRRLGHSGVWALSGVSTIGAGPALRAFRLRHDQRCGQAAGFALHYDRR